MSQRSPIASPDVEAAKPVELICINAADTDKKFQLCAITEEEKANVLRKMDLHMMPIFFILFTFSILDRSNLGNAHVAGLDESIELHGNQYSLLGTIFYVAYVPSQWMAAGWKHFPAHKFCAVVVLCWATLSTLQSSVSSFGGLAAIRFLLGISEAIYSGLPLYLSFFYPRDKLGFRNGIFMSASALANAYGGALGYAISQIKSHLPAWRILFLIEGLPGIAMVPIAWYFVPDSIQKAKFLTEREKEVAMFMVQPTQLESAQNELSSGVKIKESLAAFKDWRSYFPAILFFSCNISFASLPLFVPTIISQIGDFGRLGANGLSAPPYLLTFIIILVMSYVSDRVKLRGPIISVFALCAAAGFALLAGSHETAPRYIGIYLAVMVFACISLLLTWVNNIHSTESKRAGGWAIFATIGQCGTLVGTNIFPPSDGPYYRNGSIVSLSFCLLIAVTSATFSLLLHLENRKLDKVFEEGGRDAEGDTLRRPKGFRYII